MLQKKSIDRTKLVNKRRSDARSSLVIRCRLGVTNGLDRKAVVLPQSHGASVEQTASAASCTLSFVAAIVSKCSSL
jgi:hypothetical protein